MSQNEWIKCQQLIHDKQSQEFSHVWQIKSFIQLELSLFLTGWLSGLSGAAEGTVWLNCIHWILLETSSFFGCVGVFWRSRELSSCSMCLSSWVYKLYVTSISQFNLASRILNDNCISILLYYLIQHGFSWFWRRRIMSPSAKSLVVACLIESAYSFSLSFLPKRSSAGDNEVTVWGVLWYWKRKSCTSLFQSLPCSFAILIAFRRVLLSLSTLWSLEANTECPPCDQSTNTQGILQILVK